MTFDELADHLEFVIERGGFDPNSQCGGCPCSVCTFLRNYLKESQENEKDKN